jgi:hypothetical protein
MFKQEFEDKVNLLWHEIDNLYSEETITLAQAHSLTRNLMEIMFVVHTMFNLKIN